MGQVKQLDRIGDPTHITPRFIHPFKVLLGRHGLEISDCWGWPLDGTSPTSRSAMQMAGRFLRALGFRASPLGDQLCLLIRKVSGAAMAHAALDKQIAVTAHYA